MSLGIRMSSLRRSIFSRRWKSTSTSSVRSHSLSHLSFETPVMYAGPVISAVSI